MVRDFQQDNRQPPDVYRTLEEIWHEFGYDERSDGGNTQDTLEFLMEKIWFECLLPKR